jgi:hypothetical protein
MSLAELHVFAPHPSGNTRGLTSVCVCPTLPCAHMRAPLNFQRLIAMSRWGKICKTEIPFPLLNSSLKNMGATQHTNFVGVRVKKLKNKWRNFCFAVVELGFDFLNMGNPGKVPETFLFILVMVNNVNLS